MGYISWRKRKWRGVKIRYLSAKLRHFAPLPKLAIIARARQVRKKNIGITALGSDAANLYIFVLRVFQLWAKRLKYNMLPACFLGLTNVLNKQAACSTMLTEKLVFVYQSTRFSASEAVVTEYTTVWVGLEPAYTGHGAPCSWCEENGRAVT